MNVPLHTFAEVLIFIRNIYICIYATICIMLFGMTIVFLYLKHFNNHVTVSSYIIIYCCALYFSVKYISLVESIILECKGFHSSVKYTTPV